MADTGGPAFPVPMIPCDNQGGFTEVRCTGITKLDYFAAQAMNGLLSNPSIIGPDPGKGWSLVNCTMAQLCDYSYGWASEMLRESARREGGDWKDAIGCAPATEGSISPEEAVRRMR